MPQAPRRTHQRDRHSDVGDVLRFAPAASNNPDAGQCSLALVDTDSRADGFVRRPVIDGLRGDTASFAADIDALVAGIEHHMSRWTALLHLLQIAMMAFAVVGAAVLVYTSYPFVWELWAPEIGPVG